MLEDVDVQDRVEARPWGYVQRGTDLHRGPRSNATRCCPFPQPRCQSVIGLEAEPRSLAPVEELTRRLPDPRAHLEHVSHQTVGNGRPEVMLPVGRFGEQLELP